MPNACVEVEVNLNMFDTEDLIKELESRHLNLNMFTELNEQTVKKMLEKIYILKRQNQCYQHELDQLIYYTIGRM
jgi:hypothetical protein